ncbi:MAG: heme-copper oxidase subunit III [Pirellulaceae bacterium]|nr:heme-copper oxidase subunit III [Pirellulaceae bacterium]
MSISTAQDRRSLQGVMLLFVSLGVFFFSSLILYAIYVVMRVGPEAGSIRPFYLPPIFVLTTVILVAISTLLHLAVQASRQQKLTDLARYIGISFVLSLLFFLVQGIALNWMIQQLLQPADTMLNLYGFTLFLVLVHAAHVIGGVAGMIFLLFGLARGAYDHESHFPVRFCALYWHFLDIVWIIMLACFALAAYVSKVPVPT